MNYYEHHIGDYAEATAHLSFAEDAAYSRLIRKYYSTEAPLPADIRSIQRLVVARTDEEREAVEAVLREFFDLREDGWHNARCDEEIARFQEKRAKAKKSADVRWHSERNADGMRTHDEPMRPHEDGDANALRAQCEGNALQSPDSSHQSKNPRKRGMRLPDDFVPDRESALSVIPDLDYDAEAHRFRDYWQAKTGASATKADWPATWRNWIRTCKDSGRYAKNRDARPFRC